MMSSTSKLLVRKALSGTNDAGGNSEVGTNNELEQMDALAGAAAPANKEDYSLFEVQREPLGRITEKGVDL